jgi:hypothetical protein
MRIIILCTLLTTVLWLTAFVDAAQNQALLFESDPDSFFEVADNDVFHKALGIQMTVEAWVFMTLQGAENMVANKEDSWEFAVNNGLLQSAVQPAGQAWEWHDSGLKVNLKEWTHLAITWNGKEIGMFVNGKAGNKGPKAGNALNATGATFKVGRRERGGDTHSIFDGLIDEVRVSKTIRYQGDFDVPLEAFEPDNDTLALYHFDEEVNGTVKDFSRSGVDGQMRGKIKLAPSDAPTALSVEASGKLATLWGSLKAR